MQENKRINFGAVFSFFLLIALFSIHSSFAFERIVVLNPMIAEWSAEILGKEQALKTIVGTTEYSYFPEYLKPIPTVGPYPQIQFEKILSLKPDLIIGSSEYNRPDQLEKLKKLKLNLMVLPKENFSNMQDWIISLGKTLNEEVKAKKVVDGWRALLSNLKPSAKSKNVFFQIQYQPLITVGSDSFLNEAFSRIGWNNIFKNMPQAYPKVSREAVLEKNPDQILVFEMVKDQDDLNKVKESWRKSKVIVLNGDDFSRCSMRLLKALKELSAHE